MKEDLNKIIEARHDTPHAYLGAHAAETANHFIVRSMIPYAETVEIHIKYGRDKVVRMKKIHPDGVFEAKIKAVKGKIPEYLFQVVDQDGQSLELGDAYNVKPAELKSDQEERFKNGKNYLLYRHFGAHPLTRGNVDGVNFCVWAPNALRVSTVGNFNRWDGRCHQMAKISGLGVWEVFIPDANIGDFYKFEIKTASGNVFLKTDPYAFETENSPDAAGIIQALDKAHNWKDRLWMQDRSNRSGHSFSIFKLIIPAQGKTGVADFSMESVDLVSIKKQGFSHIEIVGLFQAESEVASYFAPDLKVGSPADLMSFIDHCHQQGLGVIIDGLQSTIRGKHNNLACFDGNPLYEVVDRLDHDCFSFNTHDSGVRNYLYSQAGFWLENYHIDGFRVDPEEYDLYWQLTRELEKDYNGILMLVYDPDVDMHFANQAVDRLFRSSLTDPFSVLGSHVWTGGKRATLRQMLPFACQAYIHFPDQPNVWCEMIPLCDEGLWQATLPENCVDRNYRVYSIDDTGNHYDHVDSYAKIRTHITAEDQSLFAAGNHYRIYEKLGAHRRCFDDTKGVSFLVWAPNAAAVSVVGSFNRWDGRIHPMRRHVDSGIWELFIPDIEKGDLYKFRIKCQGGEFILKSDPFAFYMETAPDTASIVYQTDPPHRWQDRDWLQQRSNANAWQSPVSIYEVHLGSWMRGPDQQLLNYKEMASRIIPYVMDMGFTHIEILPIAEHPYEPSWGYQVSNFYAPTSRLGNPEDLMAFIDQCHQNGIGVLLDWVAGHFPKDAHALALFDGSHLFEHEDPRQGEHKDWGTLIFNYSRHEVENFLIANALFWLEHYHFDGLRVDAVASMLYLDYSREHGEWIPNEHGGNENLDAIEFLKHTNSIVHARFPGVMMIAEESTAWPGVSRPANHGGLGFGFKWNMGWMHDVLGYMQTPPEQRKYRHQKLVFVLQYAFDENFILSLSHDEVVHLKGSLFNKMPGDGWEKFANLRLLYAFMYTHPGKKLNFMGAEFAQIEEWNESGELQWQLVDSQEHLDVKLFMKSLNFLYRSEPALFEMDCRPGGFEWIDAGNHEQSVIVFLRKAREPRNALIVVINFSALSYFDFRFGVPFPVQYREILNSNDLQFSGAGLPVQANAYEVDEIPWHGQEFSLKLRLPALSTIILKPSAPDYKTGGSNRKN